MKNVSNTTNSNYENDNAIFTSDVQYHQAPLQHSDHVQNDFVPTPHCHDNDDVKVSIPKISKSINSSQNQIKIELEIVIKLQNDQTQQSIQHVRSSTLPKNRTVNRMNPYRKPAPQLNRSSAVYMQNDVDNNIRISRSQFQPNDDLNETFRSNYDN
ncbi:hypothetical protein RclHR1_04560001 [Rhizophagus clarus]|uniref:Uncharacterized protein n=1 Tax=Rhizophagus clarus TaxID=94130 RepID=A0A2Z6S0K2_9GLOM|nr:hypothetical protein RclHR1_04560001 [Rhizophagus clarus]GES74782.1 hypothetical protein GLOIN_2v1839080 [Rhizophagus clarus]